MIIALICYGGLCFISGCGKEYELDGIVGPSNPGTEMLSISVSDSSGSMTLDTLKPFQAVLMRIAKQEVIL